MIHPVAAARKVVATAMVHGDGGLGAATMGAERLTVSPKPTTGRFLRLTFCSTVEV
jgi:hypothetical protein